MWWLWYNLESIKRLHHNDVDANSKQIFLSKLFLETIYFHSSKVHGFVKSILNTHENQLIRGNAKITQKMKVKSTQIAYKGPNEFNYTCRNSNGHRDPPTTGD